MKNIKKAFFSCLMITSLFLGQISNIEAEMFGLKESEVDNINKIVDSLSKEELNKTKERLKNLMSRNKKLKNNSLIRGVYYIVKKELFLIKFNEKQSNNDNTNEVIQPKTTGELLESLIQESDYEIKVKNAFTKLLEKKQFNKIKNIITKSNNAEELKGLLEQIVTEAQISNELCEVFDTCKEELELCEIFGECSQDTTEQSDELEICEIFGNCENDVSEIIDGLIEENNNEILKNLLKEITEEESIQNEELNRILDDLINNRNDDSSLKKLINDLISGNEEEVKICEIFRNCNEKESNTEKVKICEIFNSCEEEVVEEINLCEMFGNCIEEKQEEQEKKEHEEQEEIQLCEMFGSCQ